MNLFQLGDFVLHSEDPETGEKRKSHYKIECDALTDEDVQTIAFMMTEYLPSFGFVYGIPRGGKRLEQALLSYRTKNSDTLLIVDDVLTSGRSMEEARQGVHSSLYSNVIGAVIFSRMSQCPDWILPLFTMRSR